MNPIGGKEALRVVLRWDGNVTYDRDLFVEFRASERVHCVVGFLNPLCEGLSGKFDDKRYNLETITFNTLGRHKYLIYVGQYFDKTTLDPPSLNSDSHPTFLDIYTPSYPFQPLLSL